MNDQQANRYLTLDNQRLRAENAQLRKRLKEASRHAKRVERAYEDALLLATFAEGHIYPSRAYCEQEQAMSQRRWQNATALLRMARVLSGRRKWSTTDLATIGTRLDTARQRAVEQPDAYRSRLNRHGRS